MNVASLDIQKMSKTSFEGFMFFEFISSIHGVFDWIHVFIIHSSLWHTSFRNIFQYLLQQKTNHKELQRTTATHNNSKKKCETIRNGHTATQNGWDNVHNDPQQCKTNPDTGQKLKFCIKDFFGKCEQIRNFLRIWSYLQKKYLMENFIFSAMTTAQNN